MLARQWETDLTETGDEPHPPDPRLRDQPSPISQLLGQNLLDEAVRSLQEDLAMLQAEQERGLNSLGGVLDQLGQELGAVRAQLAALAEPLLAGQITTRLAEPEAADPERDARQAETQLRLDRVEKQVGLLVRGMDTVDSLRYQSDVHTRALARLTDLLSEVVRPRPVEGLEPLQRAVAGLELSQHGNARFQKVALALFGLALIPGLGALLWLLLRGF